VNATKARILVVSTAMLAIAMPASRAVATPATGTNPFLPANGEVYIPLKPSTSGTLGAGNTGLVQDSLTIAGVNTSTGFLEIALSFDISAEIDPNNPNIIAGTLFLRFRDLDFVPVPLDGRYDVGERLDVQFENNAPVSLDETNYGFFGPGFVPTNNAELIYEFDLAGVLGVTPAQFAQMSNDKQFDVTLTLYTDVDHFASGTDRLKNTVEVIFPNDFTFVGVPEPGTVTLIAAGCVGVLIHRRRKARA